MTILPPSDAAASTSSPTTVMDVDKSSSSPSSDSALLVKRLSEHATIPCRQSSMAAGMDLYSASVDDVTIPKQGGRAVIKTDISIACPAGTYGRVASRSGLAVKHGIHVGAGVIDADYRGNIGVVLFNMGDTDFIVKKGDRIAQLVLERIVYATIKVCDNLDDTDRGSSGFGSTGVATTDTNKEKEQQETKESEDTKDDKDDTKDAKDESGGGDDKKKKNEGDKSDDDRDAKKQRKD